MPNPLDYGWWLASRSAGIVALLAASASVILGLMMANGIPRRPGAKRSLLWAHESLALTTLVALVAHALLLLPDAWLRPGLAGIAIPFAGDYRPFYTGLGIIAGWSTIVLGLSYYARRRIGPARWRSIHRFTIAAWALGVIHTIGAGTDAGQLWMTVLVLTSVVPVAVLFAMRLMPEPTQPPAANVPAGVRPRRRPAESPAPMWRRAP